MWLCKVKRCIAVITQGVFGVFSEDSKCVLLYKLHIDYSKIYTSLISIVLSLEKIYSIDCRNVRGVLTFVRYCTNDYYISVHTSGQYHPFIL